MFRAVKVVSVTRGLHGVLSSILLDRLYMKHVADYDLLLYLCMSVTANPLLNEEQFVEIRAVNAWPVTCS